MTYPRLVADIGGTNARFAVCRAADAPLSALQTLRCDAFTGIEAAIAHYLADIDVEIKTACLAVACAIKPGILKLTNNHWQIDRDALCKQRRWSRLTLLNDFEAIALSLPHLGVDAMVDIGGGAGVAEEPMTVIGPGTGLGTAQLFTDATGFRARASEGGHAGLSPATARELAVFGYWLERGEVINRELFLSGPGLVRLHDALCAIDQRDRDDLSPSQVQQRGTTGEDPYCAEALNMFCALLGSAAGDQALATGARGGVWLAGGILPKFPDFLQHSSFRRRFEAKGKMRDYVAAIPTRLITDAHCGLLGAARAMLD